MMLSAVQHQLQRLHCSQYHQYTFGMTDWGRWTSPVQPVVTRSPWACLQWITFETLSEAWGLWRPSRTHPWSVGASPEFNKGPGSRTVHLVPLTEIFCLDLAKERGPRDLAASVTSALAASAAGALSMSHWHSGRRVGTSRKQEALPAPLSLSQGPAWLKHHHELAEWRALITWQV